MLGGGGGHSGALDILRGQASQELGSQGLSSLAIDEHPADWPSNQQGGNSGFGGASGSLPNSPSRYDRPFSNATSPTPLASSTPHLVNRLQPRVLPHREQPQDNGQAFNQMLRGANNDERVTDLQAQVSLLHQDSATEKAKALTQAKDLQAAFLQALQNEHAARQEDITSVSRSVEELKLSLQHEKVMREKAEQQLAAQVNSTDSTLRNDTAKRDSLHRDVVSGQSAMETDHGRHAQGLRALDDNFRAHLDDQRRNREDDRVANQDRDANTEVELKNAHGMMDKLAQQHDDHQQSLQNLHKDLHYKIDDEVRNRDLHLGEVHKHIEHERETREGRHEQERQRLEEMLENHKREVAAVVSEERRARQDAHLSATNKLQEHQLGLDGARKWQADHYSEIVREVSKVTERLTDEGKERQQQDNVILAQLADLKNEQMAEAASRRKAIAAIEADTRALMGHVDQHKETMYAKDRVCWQALEKLQNEHRSAETARETAHGALKDHIDRETHMREENLAGCQRAWQKAHAASHAEIRDNLRAEVNMLEQAAAKTHQDLLDLNQSLQEAKSVIENVEEDVRHRFKTAQDGQASEEHARKAEDALIHKMLEELRRAISAEQVERTTGEQHTSDRFLAIEDWARDEAEHREERERKANKELLEVVAKLQSEAGQREERHQSLEQKMSGMHADHSDTMTRETNAREAAHKSILETLHSRVQDEQNSREGDRRQLHDHVSQLQTDHHKEHEDRIRKSNEDRHSIAGLQSLQKELEERVIEQGQSLSAAIESLQEAVRPQSMQQNELLKKFSEALEGVKAALNKEVSARNTKEASIDEGLREVTKKLATEVRNREAGIHSLTESMVQERTNREEGMVRERRLAEDDVQRATQAARKAREEEERRLQERVIEVNTTIGKERDLRIEAVRVEGQKQIALKEEVARDLRAMHADMAKLAQQMTKGHEDHMAKANEIHSLANSAVEKVHAHRADVGNVHQRHEQTMRGLEDQATELHRHASEKFKDHQESITEWRRHIDDTVKQINSTLSSDHRSREVGDTQVSNEAKAGIRAEVEAREHGIAALSRDVASLRSKLDEEASIRESQHNVHASHTMSVKSDIAEINAKSKNDIVELRDLEQLKEDVFTTMREERRLREKDVLRIESGKPGVGLAPGSSPLAPGSSTTGPDAVRTLRQSMAETRERLEQIETRQKNAEERTVSMLDAIMSGLVSHDGGGSDEAQGIDSMRSSQ